MTAAKLGLIFLCGLCLYCCIIAFVQPALAPR